MHSDLRPGPRPRSATPGRRARHALAALALAAAAAPVPGLLLGSALAAQQVADTTFVPALPPPAWPAGTGPRVVVDGGHGNFHTVEGRYAPFARVLRLDGFRVRGTQAVVTAAALEDVDVYVVANALHPRNAEDWSLPTPSAFTPAEIRALRGWVEAGGALLLIADHMPFPGAADALGAAFGFRFRNGFVVDTADACMRCPIVFRRAAGTPPVHTLADHAITGSTGGDDPVGSVGTGPRVDSVAVFTGQAFLAPVDAEPLLVLGPGAVQLLPERAWQFDDATPTEPVHGWLMGAVRRVGRGRVAVFGEAAQFSAQRAGPEGEPMGMNAPVAAQNPAFLVGVLRWLAGR